MVDLAVSVIVGGAFTAIVTSLVNDVIMPSIGNLFEGIDLTSLRHIITLSSRCSGSSHSLLKIHPEYHQFSVDCTGDFYNHPDHEQNPPKKGRKRSRIDSS